MRSVLFFLKTHIGPCHFLTQKLSLYPHCFHVKLKLLSLASKVLSIYILISLTLCPTIPPSPSSSSLCASQWHRVPRTLCLCCPFSSQRLFVTHPLTPSLTLPLLLGQSESYSVCSTSHLTLLVSIYNFNVHCALPCLEYLKEEIFSRTNEQMAVTDGWTFMNTMVT